MKELTCKEASKVAKLSYRVFKTKKESEIPLVVSKVVRKYTRKKIEQPAVNKQEVNSTKALAAESFEQTCTEIKVENDIYIKEENVSQNLVTSNDTQTSGINRVSTEIDSRVDRQDPHDGLLQKEMVTKKVNIKEETSDSDEDGKLLLRKKDGVASITFDIKNDELDSNKESTTDLDGETEGESDTSSAGDSREDNRDLIQLKKCYLVAVNVAPELSQFSSNRRRKCRRRGVALLEAKKVGTPENPPPFKLVAKSVIFTCELCDKTFLVENELRVHIRAAHKLAREHKCQQCRSTFPYHFMLLTHLRKHTGRPLACDLCQKRFKQETTYSNHLNTHLRERLFSCPVCLTRFTDLYILQNHALKHSAEDVFECDACDEKSDTLIDLQRHRENVHGEKSPYPCYVCTRVLDSERDFYEHLDSHANALYECAFCAKRFTDVARWEEHSAGHIEKIKKAALPAALPYSCDICHRRFKFASTFKTHVRLHTGERPYSCQICSKTYKLLGHLNEHQKEHTRPFVCPDCGACFGRRETLDRHYRIHSGERPYTCSICEVSFSQRFLLLKHNQKLHTPGLKAKKKQPKKTGRPKNKVNNA